MTARFYIPLFLFLLLLLSSSTEAQVLTLQTPVKGDSWPGYSVQKISWASENVDNIKIESSLDSGRTWSMVINSYPASAQFFEWEVPNKVSDSCFIRITDVQNASVSSSNFKGNPFKIPSPGITVDSLANTVTAGGILPVYWTSSGIKRVRIFLSTDNRNSYTKVADSVAATAFYYNLPMLVAGTDFHIKITAIDNPLLSGDAPENFNVIASPQQSIAKFRGGPYDGAASSSNRIPSLAITVPFNDDSSYQKSQYKIQWKFDNVDKLNLYFSANGGSTWDTIDSSYNAQAGYFDWVIPDTLTRTGKIKIENTSDHSVQSVSTGNFIILRKKIQVLFPDSPLTVYRNGVLPLQWIKGGVNKIKLVLRSTVKDSVLMQDIAADAEAFNLPVSAAMPDSFRVILTDAADSTVNDSTNIVFVKNLPQNNPAKYKGGAFDGYANRGNFAARLAITKPVTGDTLSVASKQNITWVSNNVDRINIDLSTDNGNSWTRVANDAPASAGVFEWKTPGVPANQCLLKLWDSFDTTVVSVSATFVLAPKSIRNTTDSLNWTKGSPKVIEWATTGIDSVRLQYKTRYNQSWVTIFDKVPATYEAVNWVVPATLADSLFMLITDVSDSTKNEKIFTGPFKSLVQAQDSRKFRGGSFDGHAQKSNISRIIVQKPAENEVVVSGSIYSIKWSTVNLEDSILLQLSIDSGKTWVNIARALASDGHYEWQIPSTLSQLDRFQSMPIRLNSKDGFERGLLSTNSTKCLIRAIDVVSGNEVVGITSKPFTISAKEQKPKPTIVFPAIKDTGFVQSFSIRLGASASAGSSIKYIYQGKNAKLQADSLVISAPGTITIYAFAQADSDSTNCSDTIRQTFCINPPRPVLNLKDSVSIYTSDSIQFTSGSIYSHQWYLNRQPIAGAISDKLIATLPGIYTDTAYADGCYAGSESIIVNIKARPVIPTINFPLIKDTTFSASLFILLKASASAGSNVRYLYQGTTARLNGDSLIITAPGTIVIKAFAQSVADTAKRSDTISRTFCINPPKPVLNLKDTASICTKDSISLITNTGYSHYWYRNGQQIAGAVSLTLIVIQAGIYTDTVSTNGCYAGSASITVTEKPRPDTPTIQSANNTLISSDATRYQWYLNNQAITNGINKTQPVFAKGYYKVEVAKSNCWAVSKPFFVQADPVNTDQNEFVLKAYPNPAGSQFYLSLDFDKKITSYIDISITDINGNSVWKGRKLIFNVQHVNVPIFTRLAKGSNMVQVIVNGYKVKTIQIVSL